MTSTPPPSRSHELDPWAPIQSAGDADLYRAVTGRPWVLYRQVGDRSQPDGWLVYPPHGSPLRATATDLPGLLHHHLTGQGVLEAP